MSITYAQKNENAVQTKREKSVSIIDASFQSESLQRKADMANNAAQRAEAPRPNNTGMPDNLKAGIESLSGFSMDDVRVHYNSSKPATVQALAYTQGTDIHVAPGQEKHLPHEAWHVAQQMAGRVSPTTNINGMPVNDNVALEHEADVMGEKAVQCKKTFINTNISPQSNPNVTQCLAIKYGDEDPIPADADKIAQGQNKQRRDQDLQDIGVLDFVDVENNTKQSDMGVRDNMMQKEKIYIVSHGLPALGNQPATLYDSQNGFKTGENVAQVIRNLKNNFGDDKVGEVKIEACVSSLRRNTNQHFYNRLFGIEQNSLVDDVYKGLGDESSKIEGNFGYATGTDFDEEGVICTEGIATELGNLYSIYTLFDTEKDTKIRQSYRIDAFNIIEKNLNQFKRVLEMIIVNVGETLEFYNDAASALNAIKIFFCNETTPDFNIEVLFYNIHAYYQDPNRYEQQVNLRLQSRLDEYLFYPHTRY